jgi:hypothetical protein
MVHPEEQRFFHTDTDAFAYADENKRWKPVVHALSVPVPENPEALVVLLNKLHTGLDVKGVKSVVLRDFAIPESKVIG